MPPTDPITFQPPARRGRLRRRAISAAVATLAVAGAAGAVTTTAQAAPAVAVTVDAGSSLGTVPDTGVGMNTAVYDGNMNDPAAASLLKAAGIQQLRYPGGSYGDGFHWKTNTMSGDGYVAANTDFDHFMATANAVGAKPIIIANYGSGSPEEAAAWVKYANVDKHYGVKYWEIGNEVPGNGHYGSKWEIDQHADTSPKAYATNLVAFSKAMKAVDPTVRIGAVLTTPGGWPDGITGSGDQADWNHTVLSIAANSIDFVIVHWYPGAGNSGNGGGSGNSTAALLQTPENQVPSMSATVHSLLATYAGSRASSIPIAITETASGPAASTSQAAALFAPDAYMTWFEHGAFNVDWWDLHNGPGSKPETIDGQTDYMDGGVLSSGACNSGVCEPALETPFASYWGIRSISTLAAPGDTMVKASSGNSLLTVHAVRTKGGGLNVMLINKDPANSVTASLAYSGFTPAPGAVTTVSYLKGGTGLTTATAGTAASQTLPPYSITTLQLAPVGGKTGSTAPTTGKTVSSPVAVTSTSLRSFPAAGTPGTTSAGRHGAATGSQTSSGAPQGDGATTSSTPSGIAAAHDAGASIGPLALTGAGSVVTYGMASVMAVAAGSVLMLRRRKIKSAHRQ